MKILGIIGGIGPESTIEYYRAIIARFREHHEERDYPSIIINSISVNKLLALMNKQDLAAVTDMLIAEVERLDRAGADFALFASNTPHIVFDRVQQSSPIPLLSIVEATCEAAKVLGLRTVGLFGTAFTMQARFYPEVLGREGISVIVPAPDEQSFIHEKYMVELLNNVIRSDTRDRLLTIVEAMKQRDGIQGLILGGTELPLILRDSSAHGIPFLDTTQIHAKAAAARMLS
ncbi:MAG TPA: amino acid racemase [Terriglobales bacterium]